MAEKKLDLVKFVQDGGKIQTREGWRVQIIGFQYILATKETVIMLRFEDGKGKWHDGTCDKDGCYKVKGDPLFVPVSDHHDAIVARQAGFLNMYAREDGNGGGNYFYHWYPDAESANKAAGIAKSPRVACIRYTGNNILRA